MGVKQFQYTICAYFEFELVLHCAPYPSPGLHLGATRAESFNTCASSCVTVLQFRGLPRLVRTPGRRRNIRRETGLGGVTSARGAEQVGRVAPTTQQGEPDPPHVHRPVDVTNERNAVACTVNPGLCTAVLVTVILRCRFAYTAGIAPLFDHQDGEPLGDRADDGLARSRAVSLAVAEDDILRLVRTKKQPVTPSQLWRE